MATTKDDDLGVTIITSPPKLEKQINDLSQTDRQLLIVMGCITLILMVRIDFLGLMSGILLTLFLLWAEDFERRYLTIILWFVGKYRHTKKKGVRWSVSEKQPNPPTNVYPFRVDSIGGMGLPHNIRQKTDVVVLEGSGSGVSSQMIRAQAAFNTQVAEMFMQLSAIPDMQVKMSFVNRRRPLNELPLSIDAITNLRPGVFELLEAAAESVRNNEPPDPPDDWPVQKKRDWVAARKYIQTRAMATDKANDNTVVAVITIKRSVRLVAASKGKLLAKDEIASLEVVELAQIAKDSLEEVGVSDVTILDREASRVYLRAGWDVVNLEEYYDRCNKAGSVDAVSFMPEVNIEEHETYCKIDGTYHTVFRVSKFPAYMWPNSGRAIYGTKGDWLTITMVGEALEGGNEYFLIAWFMNFLDGFRDWIGISETVKSERRRDLMTSRQEEVVEHDFAEHINLLIDVAAPDLNQLESAARGVRKSLPAGIRVQRVTGAPRQVNWSLSATTGINLI